MPARNAQNIVQIDEDCTKEQCDYSQIEKSTKKLYIQYLGVTCTITLQNGYR